ncbi:MAG: hypothetical protein BTN85_0376 [Candidatus Methanohalarchaeum thermophilum]|uniref:Uncharacterized protein n=1 Tax=Methanohalarchaeum thermophilum TaxID=1903181 RepID=A0A1Q6DU50_METT1|nr:MAG: hypothetical protein BTN85_0376 [Candidatus Methanohalarchaeum thermophilum]
MRALGKSEIRSLFDAGGFVAGFELHSNDPISTMQVGVVEENH